MTEAEIRAEIEENREQRKIFLENLVEASKQISLCDSRIVSLEEMLNEFKDKG